MKGLIGFGSMRVFVAASQFLGFYICTSTVTPHTSHARLLSCVCLSAHINIQSYTTAVYGSSTPEELEEIFEMGLSHFPTASEGVLPVLVVNIALSVSHLENMVRSMLQAMALGSAGSDSNREEDLGTACPGDLSRERRISITQFKSLSSTTSSTNNTCTTIGSSGGESAAVECCVCLSGFEAEQEVSELACKHFFHKVCLDKWFDNNRITCPLCRSIH